MFKNILFSTLIFFSLSCFSTERVTVTDYPSFDDAAIAAKTKAQALSSSAQYGHVYVPAGYHPVETINQSAIWYLAAGAEFNSTNFPLTNNDDYSHLPGAVYKENFRGNYGVTLGGSDHTWIEDIRPTIVPNSVLNVIAIDSGAAAYYATTGDKPASQGNIGIQSYCVNSSNNLQNCWAGYFEAERAPDAGITTNLEITTNNYGDWNPNQRALPSGVYGPSSPLTIGVNISGPAGNGTYSETENFQKISAGIMFTSGVSGMGMDAGLVCTDAALANSTAKECIRMGAGQRIIWHGSGFNPYAGFEVDNKGEMKIVIWTSSGSKRFKFDENGITLPNGKVLN